MDKKRLMLIPIIVGTLLLIPFLAMHFSSEVNWAISDFLIMGVLLTAVGAGVELVWRTVKSRKNRLFIAGVIALIFLLIWAELAVGIFNTPFAGS